MVDFSYKLASAFPEDAVSAAPPSQQFKTAPPGNLTREHRTGPRSSHPCGFPPAEQPEPDWVCVLASPAGAALQAPVSAPPKQHPSTLAHGFQPPAGTRFASATVLAIVNWDRERSEPQFRSGLHCDAWEVVVPELVFEPDL